MSYLGRGTDKISNIEILDNITFDGSSSYSITKSSVAFTPNSAQSLLISIDGVVQATNFSVSSSTIDFGVAVPSTSTCDFFLHYGVGLITTPADGTVSLDKLSATGTKDATTFLRGDNTFASAGSPSIVDNGNATAITIDSSENVGVGETSPLGKLHVKTGDSGSSEAHTIADELVIESSESGGLNILTGSGGNAHLSFGDSADNNIGIIQYNHSDNSLRTTVNASERMRIDSSGNLLIGKTVTTNSVAGIKFQQGGQMVATVPNNELAIFNRTGSDGELLRFWHDTTQEGSISVSGSTVSYNGFTGTHWSRFTDNLKPTILKGTVLETLDEMCDWYNLEFDVIDENENTYKEKVPHVLVDDQSDGDTVTYNHNGTDYQATIVKEADIKHMKSKVSDTVDAKNVYGVFVAYDEDGEGYNDFYVASVGSFVVRIKANETIAKGDLLQSNGDGTAKVQTDDAVRSSSFAKVLSTTVIETYDDGSFIVPCSLMC